MKKLLIDAGNTSIKWCILDSGRLSNMQSCLYEKNPPINTFSDVLNEHLKTPEINEIVMTSVLGNKYIEDAQKHVHHAKLKFINIEASKHLAGVINAYKECHKLGVDRLVAMVGAYHLDSNRVSIVVDSGTATTIDAVDDQGQHLGGLILPGLDLCSQSLLEGTEQLATHHQSVHQYEPDIFSTDTKQAIASGSLFGLAGAIDNICVKMEKEIQLRRHQNSKGEITVRKLICGGSAITLLPYLSIEFTHHEDLVMQGLKVISEAEKKRK